MDFNKAQEILLRNETYVKEYDKLITSFEIAKMVIQARTKRNITQKELAKLVGTGQSSIARLESGENPPSLNFLEKIAGALNMMLLPPLFIPKEEVAYIAKSEADTQQIKIHMLNTRRSIVSTSSNTRTGPISSGNSEVNIDEMELLNL